MPSAVNGYDLNAPGEAANWSQREFNLLSAFAGLMPTSGTRLVRNEHFHSFLNSPNGTLSALNVNSNGKVGIGTTSFEAMLEIECGPDGLGNASQAGIEFKSKIAIHGLTSIYPATVFGAIDTLTHGTTRQGGLKITGISDVTGGSSTVTGLTLKGVLGDASPLSATPSVRVIASKSNGSTDEQVLAAGDKAFQIDNLTSGCMTVYGDGSTHIAGDIYTTAWTLYNSSANVTGIDNGHGYLITRMSYKKIGKLVFFMYDLQGDSTSNYIQITLPYPSAGTAAFYSTCITTSGPTYAIGMCILNSPSSTATISYTPTSNFPSDSITTVAAKGEFWYHTST